MSDIQFQAKILRRKKSPEEFKVYRAALEWGLTDPIVIEGRDDLKSEYRWRDRLEPYHHQVTNLTTFCRRLPVTLLADDVGLGKTISAGLIASELIARARVSKILIVCPKLLAPQWCDELESKFDIPAVIASGQQLIDAEPQDIGAVITTYQSARLHLEKIPDDRFDMLILDEAHKLRNLYGVEKPPQVALRFRDALEKRRFRYVLMLTATPIHNRLWDIYSLVDLLTVARGHENPFGSEGMFIRKFIGDDREQARQLKPEAREEFRSIVYGYMSRVRRGDAKLHFPDRVVQLHKVDPTPEELELISALAAPIQSLNRLAQISILQALTSSPHALQAQMNVMARNGTIPQGLAEVVRSIVARINLSAKLRGLESLVRQLKNEKPEGWRLVIFTGRLETQTTIQAFLETREIKVGIINGSSGARNKDTLARFRANPPELHVIVSTEAGSEGLNLQVANVVVNYDLPWNPMIVEQRIGRVQRLASDHAYVSIFNIILQGTFEEYIVGRLMEKLQMAAHAIGDVESLLEGSGVGDDDEGADKSFDEKIRLLVLASLAGKDVSTAARQAEQSIADAKAELEREEQNINAMLGGMDGAEYVGPRGPLLPPNVYSMEARAFVLAALKSLGANISPYAPEVYLCEHGGSREFIRFENGVLSGGQKSTLYVPGNPYFSRLVDKIVATGVHSVADLDRDNEGAVSEIAKKWMENFGATSIGVEIEGVSRVFEGIAWVRVRATVAHDSYERLVEVSCRGTEHSVLISDKSVATFSDVIDDPESAGVKISALSEAAKKDSGITEFCRFYLERRAIETQLVGDDFRKRRKLEDDFTPRLEMSLVGLEGSVHRKLKIRAQYKWNDGAEYSSALTIVPHSGEAVEVPALGRCAQTGRTAPRNCLSQCEITGAEVLRHLLGRSDASGRLALPERTLVCALSRKRILMDEAETSSVTGQMVLKSLLKTSMITGKRAEPEHFSRCEFTQIDALNSELPRSEISGKKYRSDEQRRSMVSGRTGHVKEFVACHETHEPIVPSEGERCDITGNLVRPGVLENCSVTGKRVLSSELESCAASGKRGIRKLFVTSSMSGARVLEEHAVRSIAGKFCSPLEGKVCTWSGRKCHPDDIRICGYTGLPIHLEYVTAQPLTAIRLQILVDLIQGVRRTTDRSDLWEEIANMASSVVGGGRCRVEAAKSAPGEQYLAVCIEIRTRLGFKVQHAGLIFSVNGREILGHIVRGKRSSRGWTQEPD